MTVVRVVPPPADEPGCVGLQLPYNDVFVTKIKETSYGSTGRKWHPQSRIWVVYEHALPEVEGHLQPFGFVFQHQHNPSPEQQQWPPSQQQQQRVCGAPSQPGGTFGRTATGPPMPFGGYGSAQNGHHQQQQQWGWQQQQQWYGSPAPHGMLAGGQTSMTAAAAAAAAGPMRQLYPTPQQQQRQQPGHATFSSSLTRLNGVPLRRDAGQYFRATAAAATTAAAAAAACQIWEKAVFVGPVKSSSVTKVSLIAALTVAGAWPTCSALCPAANWPHQPASHSLGPTAAAAAGGC